MKLAAQQIVMSDHSPGRFQIELPWQIRLTIEVERTGQFALHDIRIPVPIQPHEIAPDADMPSGEFQHTTWHPTIDPRLVRRTLFHMAKKLKRLIEAGPVCSCPDPTNCRTEPTR
jgi:hypothetical protein